MKNKDKRSVSSLKNYFLKKKETPLQFLTFFETEILRLHLDARPISQKKIFLF